MESGLSSSITRTSSTPLPIPALAQLIPALLLIEAQVEAGPSNTQLEDDLALVVNMSKTLALSVGYTFIENTQPPAGLKKVDTLTTLNLVYSFNQ